MLSWYGFEFEGREINYNGYYAQNPSLDGYDSIIGPFYTSLSGIIAPNDGVLYNADDLSSLWTGLTGADTSIAYRKTNYLKKIYSASNYERQHGYSLR